MRNILFAVLMSVSVGCADGPVTLDQAAQDWAEATCARQVRCGFLDVTEEQCVESFHAFICDAWDCSVEYPYSDELESCLAEYEPLACSVPSHICTVYGPPYGPGPGETTAP